MAQALTDIKSNLIFSDEKSKVTDENLNNGDVAFCVEDKSITLKYNDSLHNMGGTEIADASDTAKGITKLSDAINNDDITVAATSKAVKTTYDEAISAKTKANEAYAMGESLIPRIEVIENAIAYDGPILGVACTGEYTMEGATLAWIDNNFNEVTMLKNNYFDNHPSYKFEETLFGSDEMIKIPLCYWWRGTIPSGPFAGKWGMLLSPTANPGISGLTFKPNYVAFMDNGTLKDAFYYGKYKARNVSDVPISQYEGTAYHTITLANSRTYAANKGTGWHMATMQEYHDILARAVIEKKTFKVIPDADYGNFERSSYRGIMELRGMPVNSTNTTAYREWMDGIQVPKGSNQTYQVFDNNGNRTWVSTDMLSGPGYATQWKSDQYFDNMFIGTGSNGTVGTNTLTSDSQYLPSSHSSYVYVFSVPYYYGKYYSNYGVFGCNYYHSTNTYSDIGFRLAKF